MVGMIKLKTGYRFIVNKNEVIRLIEDAQAGLLNYATVFIDTELVRDGGTKECLLIDGLLRIWRHYNLHIIFIGEQGREPTPYIKRYFTGNMELTIMPYMTEEV